MHDSSREAPEVPEPLGLDLGVLVQHHPHCVMLLAPPVPPDQLIIVLAHHRDPSLRLFA
jgi:hypothetical protein